MPLAQFAVNQVCTYHWTLPQDLERYVAAGLPAIGIWRQKLDDYGEEAGIALIQQSGLKVSSLMWAGGFTGSDGRSFDESLEDAAHATRLAAQLKAGCLVLYTGGRGGHTQSHAGRLVRLALQSLIELAREMGVLLALELMHPACACDWTLLTNVPAALVFLNDLDADGSTLRLVYDTYHLLATEATPSLSAELIRRLGLVQLSDRRANPSPQLCRSLLGDGILPLAPFVQELRAAGYRGYVEVELLGDEVEDLGYEVLLQQLPATLASLKKNTMGAPP